MILSFLFFRCYQISINKKPQFGFQNFTRHFSAVREPLESLGDSITTAVLLSWSKQPGDNVKEDDVIAVVETDKVTMEIRAKKSGLFVEALVASGAEVCIRHVFNIHRNLNFICSYLYFIVDCRWK